MKRLVIWLGVALIASACGAWAAEIHEAAEAGNLDLVKSTLQESPDQLELRDDGGMTPFLCASAGGDLETMQYLIDAGADINAVSGRESTALTLAAFEGRLEAVEMLLGLRLDINAVNAGGFSPLMFAAYRGHADVVLYLIQNGADKSISDPQWGGNALHWACNRGNNEVRAVLLANGFEVDTRSTADSSLPIAWAANARSMEAVEFLLANGADASQSSPDGGTALHLAAGRDQVDLARLLIQNNANVNAETEQGQTPLLDAAHAGSAAMLELLIDAGADVNKLNSDSMTVLHFAVMQDDPEIISLLIADGANVNALDRFGTSPLERAAYRGNAEIARILLDAGAEISSSDEEINQGLWRAIVDGYDDFAELLLEHGVGIGGGDEHYDRTALHWAAITGNLTVAELLVEKGGDPNAIDNTDHTPLYFATKYGHKDVAEFLSARGGTSEGTEDALGSSDALRQSLEQGEAAVWYLGHVGYAIRTVNRLMIFDYWNSGNQPAYPSLNNGRIDPLEIADQNVYVFVTHEHRDHYDTAIFEWADQLPNVQYIYGFRPEELPQHADSGYHGPACEYIAPREERTIDGMAITTIAANDAGVGFYIEADGLKIYHAGDHAGWAEGEREGYEAEIDFLAQRTSDIDMAFVNVTGCHSHDTLALQEGTYYTLEKLNPTHWFPTHGNNNEHVYREFAEKVADQGFTNQAHCAENRGDSFLITREEPPIN